MPVNGDRPPGGGKPISQDQLEVTQVDNALRVETDEPHLVSITKIGTRHAAEPQDIVIEGTGVGERHCYIENLSGVITLHPIAPLCAIDGKLITQPTRLAQVGLHVTDRTGVLCLRTVSASKPVICFSEFDRKNYSAVSAADSAGSHGNSRRRQVSLLLQRAIKSLPQ
ncbi:hypothetical protein BaRGS_00017725 [Batillaria attramentaria]|uniref:FHA domain-containing protein n=1 Tax=Batillaria attramentaria TaxID=370345 RepID=A0ABD0KV60_9CAEN